MLNPRGHEETGGWTHLDDIPTTRMEKRVLAQLSGVSVIRPARSWRSAMERAIRRGSMRCVVTSLLN
mgnify:CR=1 FL=1